MRSVILLPTKWQHKKLGETAETETTSDYVASQINTQKSGLEKFSYLYSKKALEVNTKYLPTALFQTHLFGVYVLKYVLHHGLW